MPHRPLAFAVDRKLLRRKRIPSLDADRRGLEKGYGNRTAVWRYQSRGMLAPQPDLAPNSFPDWFRVHSSQNAHSDPSLKSFRANRLRHGKTLGSTLCGHISRANAMDVRSFWQGCCCFVFSLRPYGSSVPKYIPVANPTVRRQFASAKDGSNGPAGEMAHDPLFA